MIFISIALISWASVRFQLYPETAVDTINVSVELPNGSSFDETVEKVTELESLIRMTVPESDLPEHCQSDRTP